MDDFVTISLENKECKICKQETSEELISCVFNNNFSGTDERTYTPSNGEPSFAHRFCLERWDAVMQSCYCPRQKRTWRDRIKSILSVGNTKGNSIETWTPVSGAKPGFKEPSTLHATTQRNSTQHSRFVVTDEAYCVHSVGKINGGEWRRSKVRIRSVDLEDEEETVSDSPNETGVKCSRHNLTKEALRSLDVTALKETVESLQSQISEVSSELICQLQRRDSLLLQAHSMEVSAAQLINLHSNVKTASTWKISHSIMSTVNLRDTFQCT